MANVKSGPVRRRWPWALLVLFVIAAFAWWTWRDTIRGNSAAATAYAAHVTCSCRYIGGRGMEDCKKDKLEGMELVVLSEDPEAHSVTATVPLIASDTASFRKGYGCVLEPWEG